MEKKLTLELEEKEQVEFIKQILDDNDFKKEDINIHVYNKPNAGYEYKEQEINIDITLTRNLNT